LDFKDKLTFRIYFECLREGDHLEFPGVVGRIILKWIFGEKYGERRGLG